MLIQVKSYAEQAVSVELVAMNEPAEFLQRSSAAVQLIQKLRHTL